MVERIALCTAGLLPLYLAISTGPRSHAIVASLLDAGADPNVWRNGIPLLQTAVALFADRDIVELLLKHGADPNALSDQGTTALDMAKGNGDGAVVDVLRAYGAKTGAELKAVPRAQDSPPATERRVRRE